MSGYNEESGILNRISGAIKGFFHDGIKGAAGGAIAGAITFAVVAGFMSNPMGMTAALFLGAKIGAVSTGLITGAFSAFNEMVKPVDTASPSLSPRIISHEEARAMDPVIDVESVAPNRRGNFTDRLATQREAELTQSHTIH